MDSANREGVSSGSSNGNYPNLRENAKLAMQRRLENAGGWQTWSKDLYAAESVEEGLEVVFRVIPRWLPVATLVASVGIYAFVFRVRLFLNKWRKAERMRAERKYDLLDNLREVSGMNLGAVEALQDDDDDGEEDEEEEEDETAVATRDVEEFRSSLGIRLPRDEDLLSIVERMLLVDPIPDGWVLYRTSAGIIRFMNLNTQELFFFPPNKKKEKQLIESELQSRNRQAMESKYSFSYEDESMNSQTLHSTQAASPNQPAASSNTFDFEESTPQEEDATENSTFKRMFHFFLEKEQRRIDEEVARSRTNRDTISPGASPSSKGPGRPSPSAVRSPRRPSMTYRVVSSSSVHGGRGT